MDYIEFYHDCPEIKQNPILVRLVLHLFTSIKLGTETYFDPKTGSQTKKRRMYCAESGKVYLGSDYSVMNGASRETREYRGVDAYAEHLSRIRPGTTPEEIRTLINDCLRSGRYINKSGRRISPEGPGPLQAQIDICLTSDLRRECLHKAVEMQGGVPYIGNPFPYPPHLAILEKWTWYHESLLAPLPENICIRIHDLKD